MGGSVRRQAILTAIALILCAELAAAEREIATVERELATATGAKRLSLLVEMTEFASLGEARVAPIEREANELLERFPNPGLRSELLSNLAYHRVLRGNLDAASALVDEAKIVATSDDDRLRQAQADYMRGVVEFYRANYDRAIESAEAALATFERVDDREEMRQTLTLLGAIFRGRGFQDIALDFHMRALELSRAEGDADAVSLSQNNIGLIYWNLEENDKALEFLLPALEHQRRSDRRDHLATTLSNVGLIHIAREEPEKAIEFLTEALELNKTLDRKLARATVLSNLGAASVQLGEIDRGISYIEQALAARQAAGDRRGEVRALGGIAGAFIKQERYAEAASLIGDALTLAEEIGAQPEQEQLLDGMVTVQTHLGNTDAALAALERHRDLHEKLHSRATQRRIASLENRFEFERQRAEIEALQSAQLAQRRQRAILAGSVLLLGLLLLMVATLLRSRAKRLAEVRRSHARLQETEQRYRNLFHSDDQPKLLVDPDAQLLLDANTPACGLLELEAPLRHGRGLAELPGSWLRERLSQLSADQRADQPLFESWTDEDGARRACELWVGPVRMDGRRCLQVGVRDVTEARRLEEQRLRTEKLESLGLLAGGIAHDFNNSLAAILGHISLARQAAPADTTLDESLGAAESASQQASRLTSQLLSFARGGAPVRQPRHVAPLLEDAVRFALSGSANSVSFKLSRNLWPAKLDEGQFKQVISNLVINADQAMGEGGVLTVRAENYRAENRLGQHADAGPYVLIQVSDTGPGIPSDVQHRVLDPYFTTKSNGSGMGLATVFSIVTRHSGALSFESEAGRGTTFTLLFPALPEAVVATEATNESVPPGRGRILAMDDEPMLRRFYREALTMLGYQVELVPDGETAIRRYVEEMGGSRPFDLVIFDLTVRGGMGGRSAIRQLRRHDPRVRAVVASGYAESQVMADHGREGFMAALPKPFTVGQLARCLEELLASSRPATILRHDRSFRGKLALGPAPATDEEASRVRRTPEL